MSHFCFSNNYEGMSRATCNFKHAWGEHAEYWRACTGTVFDQFEIFLFFTINVFLIIRQNAHVIWQVKDEDFLPGGFLR
jgi:hypothetical protein